MSGRPKMNCTRSAAGYAKEKMTTG